MQRCVAIHANGTSEVLEFRPQLHQELRRLGYRRFVVRTADGRALSSAVYARTTPSTWQFTDAAKRLWGITGDVQAIDEMGEIVTDPLTPPGGNAVIPPRAETRVAQPTFAEGADAAVKKAGVGRETPESTPGVGREAPHAAPRARTRVDPRQVPELIARANHSLPDADPRKITPLFVADLARAARDIRLSVDEGMSVGDDAQRRALADRLDAHARALGTYLRAAR